MLRQLLCAATVLACFSTGHADVPCNLNYPQELSNCVKNALETARPSLKKQYDPMRLDDMSGKGGRFQWWVTNIQIHDLSKYVVKKLNIAVLSGGAHLSVHFEVEWPNLLGTAFGKVSYCFKLFGSNFCLSVKASPRITLVKPSGSLFTNLNLSVVNGRLRVSPSGTKVTIDLPKIHVATNLHGFLGNIDKRLGNPTQYYATQLTTKWWGENKSVVEDRLKSQLHRMIYEHLSPRLEAQMRGFKP